jgi:hypothetical protein
MARSFGVLVDAYSTGNYLPPAFDRLGVDLLHLQSTPELMPSMVPPDPGSYREFLVYQPDGETERELKERGPLFVVAGQEYGVPLADAMSEALGLRSNGSELSLARRNKHRMIAAVAAAGLRTADQLLTTDAEAAVDWATANDYWPCVAKPLASASTDGVFICRNAADLRHAFPAILSAKDIFDDPNEQVLVQSYLSGTEYIVDSVSVDGHAYVCGVWQYDKRLLPNGKPIYNRDILIPSDDPVIAPMVAYTRQVLDALGIHNGPAHSEIIITPRGPVVVEVGARVNGNMHPEFHDICLGTNQADLTALAYVRPEEFRRTRGDGVYTVRQPAIVYNTPTELSGRIAAVDTELIERIRALPSVVDVTVKRKPGDEIVPTRDLLTSPLRVFMTAPDAATLDGDYRFIDSIRESVYLLKA